MNLLRVAIKQLTASDLTFFAAHFHKPEQRSKQKAINLNADVFVTRFYPGLRDRFTELHFGLTIVGPNAAPPYILSRKAIRSEGAKNWRLNGELINDPSDQPNRFDDLTAGDIAILAFEGSDVPQHVTLVLISGTSDSELFSAVSQVVQFKGRQTMHPLRESNLRYLLDDTREVYTDFHPLEPLLTAESVEEAIYGSAQTRESVVQSNGRGAAVSPESIRRQAIAAGETGQLGEEIFERWLVNAGHSTEEFEWVSKIHGRAAFDFEVMHPHWEAVEDSLYVDVKATRGPHESPFHMCVAELRWASMNSSYRIARVSSLATQPAEIRILGDVSEVATSILEVFDTKLPGEVRVDSVEISPSVLSELHADHVE